MNALPPLPMSPALPAMPAAAPAAAVEAAALPTDGLALFQALLGSGLPAVSADLKPTAAQAKPETLAPETDAEGASPQADVLAALWMQWLRPIPAADTPAALPDVPSEPATASPKISTTPAAKMPSLPITVDTSQVADQITQATPSETPLLPEMPVIAVIEQDAAGESFDLPAAPTPASVTTEQGGNSFASLIPAMSGGTTATTAPTAQAVPQPPPAPLNTQQADWTNALGEHIAWSLDAQQDAVIELHPAELGSLNVRVEMRGNDAQVTIVAGTPAARELLQQSLPQLRELLSVQGLSLSRAQIERPSGASFGSQNQTSSEGRERGLPSRGRRALSSLLLVDSYA